MEIGIIIEYLVIVLLEVKNISLQQLEKNLYRTIKINRVRL